MIWVMWMMWMSVYSFDDEGGETLGYDILHWLLEYVGIPRCISGYISLHLSS
jgi:hypothetical protein